MWIKDLRIQEFQSHKDTRINLHPHFNIFVGNGNSGKTAIVRALSFVLFGQWSSSWVRHGAKACRITVTTDSNIEIVREKGEKINRYIIIADGKSQVYENFGTRVPEEVQKILGIFKVSVGDKEEINLNLSTQLEPLFLLSNPGSYKAKVIGTLSKAHYLDHALRELNKDKKKWTMEKTLVEKELEVTDIRLKAFDGLETKRSVLDEIHGQLEDVQKIQSKLDSLRQIKQRIGIWKTSNQVQTDLLTKLSPISDISFSAIEVSVARSKALVQIKNRILVWKTNHAALSTHLERITEEKATVIESYVTLLKRAKKCPTCFSSITDDTLEKIQKEL